VFEFETASNLSDPVSSAAALKRFIAKHRPGAATAAGWPLITDRLLDSKAPSLDVISAGRLALSHLSLVGDSRTAVAVADGVADELDRRHEFLEVANEFRGIANRIKNR
jgi:hypothetical protein